MNELPKAYEPKVVDPKWYQYWLDSNFFTANAKSNNPKYCIVMPPPNVTGVLHMGHALVSTLQDILIRWKRMSGFEVLWVPGTDHAGISTQTVVERHLIATMGKKRTDFSKEEFLKYVWERKEISEEIILQQLKKLGCSCDWTRLRFTMDPGNNRAVKTMFKKLFDAGLIYQGDYIVNWDPVTQTALADDEVEYEERRSFLWHIRYPLADESGFIHIATTRPETMLGDTAVAVSPNDPRYKHLVGKMIRLPLTGRLIPIIADHYVDPEFGSGAVKITPAHDPNDYQVGLRHKLPSIIMMTPNGYINENGVEFSGLSMAEGRSAIVEKLKQLGLLEKVEPHVNRVGLSYRSKAVIEPYLSKQWFIRMGEFAKKLREDVESGQVKLIPSHWENTYFYWIDHLRDWCISRQLWWGHQIPIWHHQEDPTRMICYDGDDVPDEVKKNPDQWVQESDVLDTWFSSSLWPFSALGWPEKTPELKEFYPNSVLVTGHDILFFWVARMIFMGQYAMEQVPFPETFLHGLIYGKSYWRERKDGGILYVTDEERHKYDLGQAVPSDVISKWEKMSKSKGNIIDPLEMIDAYGTDAVRMALCASATQARQIDLDRRRFEEFKNFANKIWNGARFIFMNLGEYDPKGYPALSSEALSKGLNKECLKLEDRWILATLSRTIQSVTAHLERYQFDQAAMEAYDFFWKELCAYYLEIAKMTLTGKSGSKADRENKQKLLVIVLCQAIRLLHPMAPFITEELFQILKSRFPQLQDNADADAYTRECVQALKASGCIVAPFPQSSLGIGQDEAIQTQFDCIQEVIYTIRNIRGEMKLAPATATDIYIIAEDKDPDWILVNENKEIIQALVRTRTLFIQNTLPQLAFASTGLFKGLKILLPMPEELLKQESARLEKELEKLDVSLSKLRQQLENNEYISRAPAVLVEKQQAQLAQGEIDRLELKRKLKDLTKSDF